MTIWAKVDSDMPTDGKLIGQPIATRHLWTCLICLARKQDDHGAIRGYDCALLAGAFNLPKKSVAAALTYFQAVRIAELDPDGTIRLLNFTKWQGEKTLAEQREEWRARQDKTRTVTRDTPAMSPVTPPRDISKCHATEVEVEVEEKKKEQKQPPATSPPSQPLPSLEELSSGWPPDLLSRVHEAIASTRASGRMADGPWRGFLMKAKQFTPEIRVRASNEYLDRAYAAQKKAEAYLIGIMRGESDRARLPAPLRPGAATLQITPEAKAEHAIPGRKFL